MNHDDLKAHIDRRFDQLEERVGVVEAKLDQQITNTADIAWLKKGFWGLITALLTLGGYIVKRLNGI